MAKQTGPVKWERTIDDLVLYKLYDQWYARAKSSLTGERVKTDEKFKKTMQYASNLGVASQLASAIYQTLTEDWKAFRLYRRLTGVAYKLVNAGKDHAHIAIFLHQFLADLGYPQPAPTKRSVQQKDISSFPCFRKQNLCGSATLRATPSAKHKACNNKTLPHSQHLKLSALNLKAPIPAIHITNTTGYRTSWTTYHPPGYLCSTITPHATIITHTGSRTLSLRYQRRP